MSSTALIKELKEGINLARTRVYQVSGSTPLERIPHPAAEVWVKREDLGPIKAYKWRGAYNAIASLSTEQKERGIVAASAGNHAQGVALAAKTLGCQATIFMPTPTPQVKQDAVYQHGGDAVEIKMIGDSFSEAQKAAIQYTQDSGATFIPPYDSIPVIAGQGTLADEIVTHAAAPFDRIYVAIGGGGMASAVSTWLKSFWPDCKVIGVEGVQQACMAAAFAAGKPSPLDYVDLFCDGTAVTQAGEITYQICRDQLDGIITVTNEEVSEAIKAHWDALRVVPEPSGAMSFAGFQKDLREGQIQHGEKCLTILCGANMDFAQLAQISRQAGLAARADHSWKFSIPDKPGSLVELLESLPKGVSIYDLQYGRTHSEHQHPVLRLVAPPDELLTYETWLIQNKPGSVDVSSSPQGRYRVIPFSPDLYTAPWFIEVEFPERAGALLAFMREIRAHASLCYFNYTYSGERVGRALLGLEFLSEANRETSQEVLKSLAGTLVRTIRPVEII